VLVTGSSSIYHNRKAQGKEHESRTRSAVFLYHLQFMKSVLFVSLSVFDYFSLKWVIE
jgi:hypothetical protein